MQLKGTPDGGKCTFSVANAFEWDTQMYIYMKKYLPVDLIGWERDAMDIKEKCEAEGIWSWTGPKRENGEIVRLSPLQKVYWFPICYGKNFGKSPKKEEEESTKKRNFGGSDWPWAEQSNRFVPCSGRFSPFFFLSDENATFQPSIVRSIVQLKISPCAGEKCPPHTQLLGPKNASDLQPRSHFWPWRNARISWRRYDFWAHPPAGLAQFFIFFRADGKKNASVCVFQATNGGRGWIFWHLFLQFFHMCHVMVHLLARPFGICGVIVCRWTIFLRSCRFFFLFKKWHS